MTDERYVGYFGQDNVSVAVAFAGVLHWEAEPKSATGLCQPNRRFSMRSTPSALLGDKGYVIAKLRICKKCARLASDE